MNDSLFVFDTNTLISAILIPSSTIRKALDRAIDEGKLVFSEETIGELRLVLVRSKFDQYVSLDLRLVFLEEIEKNSVIQTVSTKFNLCRDPKDDMFLSLAHDSKANYIISGDKDLLVLNPFGEIQIITPVQFLTQQL